MGTSKQSGASKDLYVCELCGQRYVVRSLARHCEMKHLQEDE